LNELFRLGKFGGVFGLKDIGLFLADTYWPVEAEIHLLLGDHGKSVMRMDVFELSSGFLPQLDEPPVGCESPGRTFHADTWRSYQGIA